MLFLFSVSWLTVVNLMKYSDEFSEMIMGCVNLMNSIYSTVLMSVER